MTRRTYSPRWTAVALVAGALIAVGCGDDGSATDSGGPDAGPPDAQPASTTHCDYAPLPATAGAGGTVMEGALTVGAAELPLELPVGSALGSYTARASGLGPRVGVVDRRFVEIAGGFNASVGYEMRPKVRAVALSAGGDTLVLLKVDIGYPYEGLTVEVERALGPDYAGKTLIAASHSHSAWGHYSANEVYQLGSGEFRRFSFDRTVEALVTVARAALDAREPAMIGFHHDPAFDPEDRVNRDRRGENDEMSGGSRDDSDLFVIRLDATDGSPIALIPVFGIHGTINDADNNLASTDSVGAIERALEERFDEPVVVMHLQGVAGDVSPAGSGDTACPESNVCYSFARSETVGRYAADAIYSAWEQAGEGLVGMTSLDSATRAVPLGPDWRTFTIRDGALAYTPWDGETRCDGIVWSDGDDVWNPGDTVVSPIDEFNAPFGAGLCGEDHTAIFPMAQLPGTLRVLPYKSCMTVPVVGQVVEDIAALPFGEFPACGTTTTLLQSFRIGDWVFAAFPGEVTTLYADLVRSYSPRPAEDTVLLGYSHGEIGYLLTVEDWLLGGYEPTINVWGPLQGEYLAERMRPLMELAASDSREDAAAEGVPLWVTPDIPDDDVPGADAAPMAGTVLTAVPAEVYVRNDVVLPRGQPAAMVARLDSAYLAWIGEDPMAGTPVVTLEREQTVGVGDFAPVRRRSGRAVVDGDILVTWTPQPFLRAGTMPRTHYWVAEWQAAMPWGTAGLDDLEDRPGVPLGRYRFHVSGTGYEIDSQAFEVVPCALGVTATLAGSSISASATYQAPGGFRLLHMTTNSNDPIPLVRGPVTVDLGLASGATRSFADVPVAADGSISVDAGGDAAMVRTVRVIDRFGNRGDGTL